MAETVNVPGLGPTKKPYVIAGVGAVAVFGIMWYRSRQNASGSTSGTSTASSAPATSYPAYGGYGASGDPYPPDGTTGNPSDPYSTDPSTGMTYGDEQLGYGGSAGYGYGGYGGYGGGSSGGYPTTGGPGSFTSNAQWSQYAEQYLTQTGGMGAATVGNALGKYITGQAVSPAQEQVINDAIAIAGYPPVSGPGNYPPSINVSGSKTGGKTYADNPVAGLVAVGLDKTQGHMTWHESNHASSYQLVLKEKGRTVASGSTAALDYQFNQLKPKTSYEVTVLAVPAKPGAKPASASFTTK